MVKTTMQRYQNIDPDYITNCLDKSHQPDRSLVHMQEQIFLEQFSSMLECAGYVEIPASVTEKRLKSRLRYGKVAVSFLHNDYFFSIIILLQYIICSTIVC